MSENNNRDDLIEQAKEEISGLRESVEKAAADMKESAKEPIASIEQTVEDLKKKIQGLSEEKGEGEASNPIEFKISDEQKEKIEVLKNNTAKTVNDTIDDVRRKAEEFTKGVDVQKTLDYIKDNVVKAVDTAKQRFDELRDNPDVKKTIDEAGTKVREFSEKAGSTVEGLLSEDQMNALKKNIDKASEVMTSTVDTASKKITEFVNKPEVQETIEKTKSGAKEFADKGSAVIKDIFDKKEGE
jgi:hypothetical protein